MRVAVEPEYVFAVVETQTLAPLGQRRIRFRTPHEDHIPLPQVFAGHFEILADPNSAFIHVQEPLLQLLGRISVGARFSHGAVNQYRRVEPVPDVGRRYWFTATCEEGGRRERRR